MLPRCLVTAESLALLLMASVTLPVCADEVVFRNGDRVTGAIVKKDDKNLTIKTALFGPVTVAWDQVQTITADTPLNVVLPAGKTVTGTVTTADGSVQVKSADATASARLTEVEALRDAAEQRAYERLLRPGWIDLWTLTGSIGLAGATGNARTNSFVIPIGAARTTRSDKTSAYFNLITASARTNGVTEATARAVRGGWAYSRNLTPKLFWTLFNDNEYDRFQNLDLRTVVGSGLGYSLWKSDTGQFDLVGGLAWNREAFDPPQPQQPFVRNAMEAFWGNNWNATLNARMALIQSYRMFNPITDSGGGSVGGLRQNFDIGLTTKITRWLTWKAALSDRYLANPVPGRKKNDIVYSTGLGFEITR